MTRRRAPLWIPPFLGRVPDEVEPRQLSILGMVALALLFTEYDISMLTSALKQIAHELGMVESELGFDLAMIRLGALPALVLVPLADRIGRRPAFLGSTVLLALFTFATAFVTTRFQFVVLQGLARTFYVTGTAVAFVIVTEELPAAHRGWGMGMLAALGACGHGLGAGLFSQIDRLPYGFRALYAVGVVPLLLLPVFMRRVPETTRYAEQIRDPATSSSLAWRSVLAPLRTLAAENPARALGLGLAAFCVAGAMLPSFQFSGYFTQHKLGWTPGNYSLMVIAGGAVGIVGNVAAGRLGDAFGRRGVGVTLLVLFPIAAYAFYHGASWVVAAAWVPLVFCAMGGRIILRALSTELFATSHRGAASGVFTVMETLGAVAGLLAIHYAGTRDVEEIIAVVPVVSLLVVVSAGCLLFFPETRARELEELSAKH